MQLINKKMVDLSKTKTVYKFCLLFLGTLVYGKSDKDWYNHQFHFSPTQQEAIIIVFIINNSSNTNTTTNNNDDDNNIKLFFPHSKVSTESLHILFNGLTPTDPKDSAGQCRIFFQ